ncbi:phosphate regulon sensor histidine kinase PhoR [Thioalkalivibrio sp. ALJ24]|uniref:phosphate regulon sensor histidine kinase PhoR n=1 Tax=Thioalkalivibrio sp. ALJ24 TaxID=545276 RepID=UPI00036000AD|nr:phosphate regulon sensor histidine kinase PhoR [Thioalkalivibrio sp. ALJ24]
MQPPPNPWPRLVARHLLIALTVLAIGGALGYLLEAAIALLGALLAWNLWQLYRLENWIRRGGRSEPPDAPGLWGEIFTGLHQRRQRRLRRVAGLRRLLDRYRESASALPDAVVVLNPDYRIEWANQTAARLLGLDWPADEGRRITHLVRHPEFMRFMDPDSPPRDALNLPSPVNADLWLEVRLVPYGDHQFLLLARDTTHLHRLEVMRRDFIANVSHELRTPLTVLYGVAETLEDELEDQPELFDSVKLLREQSERMKLLVDDLLMLSRLETGSERAEQDWFNPGNLLRNLVHEAELLSGERGHRIELENEPGLEILGTENELRSAFANLVFNAVKYTPPGTRIRVQWKATPQGGHLAVIDDGPGIAGHHLERLTERFYRVDSGRTQDRGGTGLGLAIVKHVLLRHDGQLHIDSELGRGSRFACQFPAERLRRAVGEAEIARSD